MAGTPDAAIADLLSANAALRQQLAERDAENCALLARQAASIEVLRAISASPDDPQPVFELIHRRARELCNAQAGNLVEFDGTLMHQRLLVGFDPEATARLLAVFPRPPGPDTMPGRSVLSGQILHVPDAQADLGLIAQGRGLGARAFLNVPLLREGRVIGVLGLARFDPGEFDQSAIELVQSFAEQAVIAISGAATLRELRERTAELARRNTEYSERIDHQAATIDVLKAMSASPGDPQPVFELIVERARDLCGGYGSTVWEFDGTLIHHRAATGVSDDPAARAAVQAMYPMVPTRAFSGGRAILDGRITRIDDYDTDPNLHPSLRNLTVKSSVQVPFLRDGVVIGALGLGSRERGGFSDSQIELLKTFAEQAVIAITSAETFRALQIRTSDLQESLEFQTATSDVLKVISGSTFDLEPVFESVVTTAVRLCYADQATIYRFQNGEYRWAAACSLAPEYERIEREVRIRPGTGTLVGRVALEGRVVQILDAWTDPLYEVKEDARVGGVRTMLGVPLLRDGEPIGVIGLARRRVEPFTDRQIELVRTFADQAVIAIENTRLLTETQEALEQQTATAEVLQVINASPGELTPVFSKMLEAATRLCEAAFGELWSADRPGGPVALLNVPPAYSAFRARGHYTPGPGTFGARFQAGERVIHVVDLADTEAYRDGDPGRRAMVDLGGARSAVGVALFKDDAPRGSIVIYRQEVKPFSDRQIALLQNFAAQAVIAMENARLINETREALEQQTATAEVLQVINTSAGDLAPVFDAMLEKAMRLCGAAFGMLRRLDEEQKHYTLAARGVPAAYAAILEQLEGTARFPDSSFSHALAAGRPDLELDIRATDAYKAGYAGIRAIADLGGARTVLTVPLVKDQVSVGYFILYRLEVRPFTDKQIALLENFAAQAVIAMDNARLLTEQREALERQTAMADVLRVINENPGDLVPVFDAILDKALDLSNAAFGILTRFRGEKFWTLADRNLVPEVAQLSSDGHRAAPGTLAHRLIAGDDVATLADVRDDDAYRAGVRSRVILADAGGARSLLMVALRKDGRLLGALHIYRKEVRAFTDVEIAVVRAFADQAVIAMENARLLGELRERTAALAQRNSEYGERIAQQAATIDVLKVMSASPGDPQPVFELIAERARAFCEADGAAVALLEDDRLHLRIQRGYAESSPQKFEARFPLAVDTTSIMGRTILAREAVQVPDIRTDHSHVASINNAVDMQSVVGVPMLRAGMPIGTIALGRRAPGDFSTTQVELLKTFAEQAVIAIGSAETYRALQERTAALARRNSEYGERIEQQSATIDVLKVMSSAPDDTQPVFDQIVRRAKELCNGSTASLFQFHDGLVHFGAVYSDRDMNTPAFAAYHAQYPMAPTRGSVISRAILDSQVIHIKDIEAEPGLSPAVRTLLKDRNYRSQVVIPLMRDGQAIGCISLTMVEPGGFTDSQISLLQTFAEQAVIAIGTAETYRALQERTAALAQRNSEYGERIEQQAATIDVLKVMSSTPDDTQPVFDQICRRATELCNGIGTALIEFDGTLVRFRAVHYSLSHAYDAAAHAAYMALFPMVPTRGLPSCRAILDKQIVHIRDVLTDHEMSDVVRAGNSDIRSHLTIPLLRDGEAIGAISLRGEQPGGFTDSQVALLQTFAEQAVIAIGSVANFRALRERTEALARSVAELQALEEVLRAVNSSLDLDTVLETIVSRAVRLSRSDEGTIYEFDATEQVFVPKSAYGMSEQRVALLRERRIRLGETHLGRSAVLRAPVFTDDVQQDPSVPNAAEALPGIHAVLAVPLLRDDTVIGGLVIRRHTEAGFPPATVTLMQTFAGQAVLAIENARLFQELATRGEEARRARVAAEAALSDLRRTQDRLVQTEKLASLGQLTAGIAHEIKNPLNFVNNFSDLSVDLLDELHDAVAPEKLDLVPELRAEIDEITTTLKGNLERIAQHGRRADSIVKNMLLHSRTGPSEHRPIDLNATVEEALNLAYHGARAETPGFNITLEKRFDPHAGSIEAFPQEFIRVMLNLIGNGFYAARKRGERSADKSFEPTLTLTTRDLGAQVEIRVRDNGTGIPPDVREKIFEPFFTTKPAGEGTGLGLSLSYDIVVKQHNGQLTVDSQTDNFTEFTIVMPRRMAASDGGRT